jgi:TPR repeat protein
MKVGVLFGILLLGLLLAACNPLSDASNTRSDTMTLLDLPGTGRTLHDQLAFTCAYEKDRLPEPDPELELLFQHARWLQKKNLLKNDRSRYPPVERLYRIAAAHGHVKAMNNLTVLILQGKSDAIGNVDLVVDMTQDLINRGIPQGYYNMGVLLGNGYGVVSDKGADLQYMRKAADLGSVDGQFAIGFRLKNLGFANPIPYEIGKQMVRCAADQGHAEAAYVTAINLKNNAQDNGDTAMAAQLYADALRYYQIAVKAGNSTAALPLHDSFLCTDPNDQLDYLGLAKDEERASRYEAIRKVLHAYDDLKPTVDEIDEIVPLPPAKLLPWDGQIKWVKEWKADIAPPLPSEERITELEKAKGLDPSTGRPIKETP